MSIFNIAIILPNITTRAGTERAVTNLANILNSQGHQVHVISIASKQGEVPYKISEKIGIHHLNLPYKKHNIFFVFIHYLSIFTLVKEFVKKKQIEICIGVSPEINVLLTFASKKIKTIGCEHFNFESNRKTQQILKHLFYKRLNYVVLLTERDKMHYTFLNNTAVIPNSLPFSITKSADCTAKKMISLGRLCEQKGYDLLIEALKLIRCHLSGWTVEIYGDGQDKESLISKINEYRMEEIVFIKDPVADVEKIYQSASIFLSPSRWEGFPMVLLEAQASGLPCVAFDYPCGAREIILNDKTGYVVDMFDLEEYSKKVLNLVTDEKKRFFFSENAIKESVRFSSENIGLKWKKLFESI